MTQPNRNPYDRAAQQELVALLERKGSLPHGAPPDASIDIKSGFLERLVDDYFKHGSLPVRLKDVTKSLFGVPTDEGTLTWGSNASHWAQTTNVILPPVPAGQSPGLSFTTEPATPALLVSEQLVHVNRGRPTTFSIMTTVDFGLSGWTGENEVDILISHFVGIGQGKTTIQRLTKVTVPSNNTQPVFDVVQVPLQALQSQVTIVISNPAVSLVKSIAIAILAAPVVQ
jgi:hypothetical protein